MSEPKRRPKGSGGVRNRGTDRTPRWEAFYYLKVDGKRKQRTKSPFRRKADAEAWLREELRLVAEGRAPVPNRLTVGEALDGWLGAVGPRVEQSTWSGYERDVRLRLKPQLGDVRLDELQPAHIVTMLGTLRQPGADRRQKVAKGLGETTLQHTFDTLRAALNWAAKSRMLGYNPTLDVDRPQREGIEIQVWTFEQLGQFMAYVSNKRFHPFLRLAAFTGMRRSELLGLLWRDVELDASLVRVKRARIKDGYTMVEKERPKSSRGRRVVDLDETTVSVLKQWRRQQDSERQEWGVAYEDSGAVFTNENGTKVHADRVAQACERWLGSAPVPTIRFHDLRHTHASLLLAQGVPVVDVAYRLGDSPDTILSTYAHFIPGQGQAAAALFAQMADGRTQLRRRIDGE